ncbi:hypothetical protein L3Q82_006599 [Scortum barcoo]|uniref:Uncharacterized protein n=1 Tax=Scortum barcoo TaxID=214431 RepID=A0ACB8X0A9_9TELE|nr:hypothetical protein L3Q82_006599 [Scortum barcoo]
MHGGIGSSRPPATTATQTTLHRPSWTFLRVVSLLEGGPNWPTSPFRAEPGRVPWAKTRPPGARLRAPTPGPGSRVGPQCLARHLGPVCHGRPYQGHNAPDNIAPRIIRAHKPLHQILLFIFVFLSSCFNKYFAEHDKATALQMLHDSLQPKHNEINKPEWEQKNIDKAIGYSFAIVGINITDLAYSLLVSGALKTHLYNVAPEMPSLLHFQQTFCYLMQEFHRFWIEEDPSDIMEFNRVRSKFHRGILRQLKNPDMALCPHFSASDLHLAEGFFGLMFCHAVRVAQQKCNLCSSSGKRPPILAETKQTFMFLMRASSKRYVLCQMPADWTSLPVHAGFESSSSSDSIAVYTRSKHKLIYDGYICPAAPKNMPLSALQPPPKPPREETFGQKYARLREKIIAEEATAEALAQIISEDKRKAAADCAASSETGQTVVKVEPCIEPERQETADESKRQIKAEPEVTSKSETKPVFLNLSLQRMETNTDYPLPLEILDRREPLLPVSPAGVLEDFQYCFESLENTVDLDCLYLD